MDDDEEPLRTGARRAPKSRLYDAGEMTDAHQGHANKKESILCSDPTVHESIKGASSSGASIVFMGSLRIP